MCPKAPLPIALITRVILILRHCRKFCCPSIRGLTLFIQTNPISIETGGWTITPPQRPGKGCLRAFGVICFFQISSLSHLPAIQQWRPPPIGRHIIFILGTTQKLRRAVNICVSTDRDYLVSYQLKRLVPWPMIALAKLMITRIDIIKQLFLSRTSLPINMCDAIPDAQPAHPPIPGPVGLSTRIRVTKFIHTPIPVIYPGEIRVGVINIFPIVCATPEVKLA